MQSVNDLDPRSSRAYTKVGRGHCIKHIGPGETSIKDLTNGLILFFFQYSVCNSLLVSAEAPVKSARLQIVWERPHRTSYFGSHCTYPLLRPFTSLITISKPLKSSMATVSKATSKMTRDHSKNA